MVVPRVTVGILFYLLVAPMVYKEAGIVTTIMIGLLSVELAVKGDWLEGMHTITMRMADKVKEVYEFQNEFIANKAEKNDKKTVN